ncbi:MAG TPA: hypothetical protein VGW75_05055 [Solirubrobacteraceae bacterium]|jgi:hypothetical protein|nr:hypothetical protein [Solirubrobacteraceae bacterium]
MTDTVETSSSPGEVVVQFRASPAELTERCGVQWSSGADDLDQFDSAMVDVPTAGDTALLVAYRHDPERSVQAFMRADADLSRAIDALLATLGVSDNEVIGRLDHPPPAPGSPEDPEQTERLVRLEHAVVALQQTVDVLARAQALTAQGFPVRFSPPEAIEAVAEGSPRPEDIADVIGHDVPHLRAVS